MLEPQVEDTRGLSWLRGLAVGARLELGVYKFEALLCAPDAFACNDGSQGSASAQQDLPLTQSSTWASLRRWTRRRYLRTCRHEWRLAQANTVASVCLLSCEVKRERGARSRSDSPRRPEEHSTPHLA
jgi:hypothetical protein